MASSLGCSNQNKQTSPHLHSFWPIHVTSAKDWSYHLRSWRNSVTLLFVYVETVKCSVAGGFVYPIEAYEGRRSATLHQGEWLRLTHLSKTRIRQSDVACHGCKLLHHLHAQEAPSRQFSRRGAMSNHHRFQHGDSRLVSRLEPLFSQH